MPDQVTGMLILSAVIITLIIQAFRNNKNEK